MVNKPKEVRPKVAERFRLDREAKIAKIQPLLDKGLLPTQISHELNMSLGVVNHIVRRYCKRPYIDKYGNQADWKSKITGLEEADTKGLTPEQIAHAQRLGISLGRYAWLLSCPRSR